MSEDVAKRRRTDGTEESGTMLEWLAQLSAHQRVLRVEAAKNLIEQLVIAQGDSKEMCDDLSLTVDRLIFGLSSGRDGSRPGYAAALIECLIRFPQISLDFAFSVMDKKVNPAGEKGDLEKQLLFGRIFFISCLIKSGRFNSATLNEKERRARLTQCFAILVSCMDKRSYLKEIVCFTVLELLHLLKGAEEFRSLAFQHLQPVLSKSPEDCSPEALVLLLVIENLFEGFDAHVFNGDWAKGVPLVQNTEQMRPAILASSYTVPRPHFMWKILLTQSFAKRTLALKLWDLIDSVLVGSHVDNRMFLGLFLLIEYLKHPFAPEDIAYVLTTRNTARTLAMHLGNKVTKMSNISALAIETLMTKVSKNPSLGVVLLRDGAVKQVPTLEFQIIPMLDCKSGLEYLKTLLERMQNGSDSGEMLVSCVKRGWKRWGASEDAESQASLKSFSKEIVRAFAKLAYVDGELTAEKKAWALARLTTILTEFEHTGHAQLLELCRWVLKQKGTTKDSVMSLVKRAIKRTPTGAKLDRYHLAFGKVLSLLGLRLLEGQDVDETVSMFEDVENAMQHFDSSEKDLTGRNKAVLVFLSVLIGLLTTPSQLNRIITVTAFRLMAPMIPAQGVHEIVKAALAKEEEAEDETLALDPEDAVVDEDVESEQDEEDEEGSGGGGEEGGDDHDHDHDHDHMEDEVEMGDGDDDDNEDIGEGFGLPDMDIDDVDPEYLKKLEESLANVFRTMKEEKTSTKKLVLEQSAFRLRVLDLLEHFVHSLSRVSNLEGGIPFTANAAGDNRAVIFALLPVLLAKVKSLQFSTEKALSDKLSRIITRDIGELREWPSIAGYSSKILRALDGVLAFVTKGNPSLIMVQLTNSAICVLIRILLKDQVISVGEAAQKLMPAFLYCCTKKNMKFLTVGKFFEPLWSRLPDVGYAMFPLIAKESTSNTWLMKNRLTIMQNLIDYPCKLGKAYMMKNPSLVESVAQSVERTFLSLVRFLGADEKTVRSTTLTPLVRTYKDFIVKIVANPKTNGGKFNAANVFQALPNRTELYEAFEKLVAKNPGLDQGKCKTELEKLRAATKDRKE